MPDTVIAIRIRPDGSVYRTQVQCGSQPARDVLFDFERGKDSQVDQALQNLRGGYFATDDLKYVGSELWDALLPGSLATEVREAIEGAEFTELVLEVPPELEELPWEALWDQRLRFVATHPKLCLSHKLPDRDEAAPDPTSTDQLAILVVIPQGSGLDAGGEFANLRASVAKLEKAVNLEVLRDIVTPDALSEALTRKRWHIVHFIGHGRLNDSFVELRLNNEQGAENWRNADQFSALFLGAQVDACVLNCCDGGAAEDVRMTDRLAPALLDAGVRGVVAMRYTMPDTSANRFAQTFYEQLLHGSRPGQLSYAAQLARKSLLQNATRDSARSFVTPLVHVKAGSGHLFQIQGGKARASLGAAAPITGANLVPNALLEAIRRRACIPVIGPELVAPPPQHRDAAPQAVGSAGLRGLIARLRQVASAEKLPQSQGPNDSFQEQWPVDAQLSRLAERFEASLRWNQMLAALRDHYARSEPAEMHRMIASWGSPGVFCTHFDGLLEAAFATDTRTRVVRKLTDNPEVSAAASAQEIGDLVSLLVLVRGSVSDPESLVLSEHDHFALADKIERMHPSIASLTKGHWLRSVIFLGISPADPVARQLARKLLLANDPRSTESFFVLPDERASDELFWRRYRVTFVRADTETVVRALTAARNAP